MRFLIYIYIHIVSVYVCMYTLLCLRGVILFCYCSRNSFFSAKQYSVTGIIGGSSGGSNCCLKS